MLKLGALRLKSNLILAPMAGVSDLPFRMLNRRFGAELAFIEMINCRSISYKSKRTQDMLSSLQGDRPLGIQLLGSEPQYILKAIDILRKYKFDILDFNAACPAKKVARRGEGASLLREPKKLQKLLKLLVEHSPVPVTVKIRTGWDKDSVNAREVALYAQEAGVVGLFIHGRNKLQGYSGTVDYRVIREAKKSLDIPLIASGDVFSAQLAKKMLDETGCDGLAVARGSLGNPWIFRQIKEYMRYGCVRTLPDAEEVVSIMRQHLAGSIDFYGERNGVMLFRKFFNWYTKGMRKVRPLREKASRAKTQNQMLEIIERCK